MKTPIRTISRSKERQPGEIGSVEDKIDKYKWKKSKGQAG